MKNLFIIAAIAAMPALPALAAPNQATQYNAGSSPKTFQISPRLTPLTPILTDSQFRLFQQTASTRGSVQQRAGSMSGSSKQARSSSQRVSPYNFGSECIANPFGCIAYTNARVANSTVNSTASTANQPVGGMPYVATGKLLIAKNTPGQFNSWCSASLIGKGLLVTAAHCVHNYGTGAGGFYKSLRFIPAQNSTSSNTGPYGSWDFEAVWIPTVYLNGTDVCTTRGIVCNNDVAVVLLKKNSNNQYPFAIPQIGYYGYGWNGYGFRPEGSVGTRKGMITQLGYPGGLDNGMLMQRGDSYAQYTGTGFSTPTNLIMGSQMNGGSSGGPWIVNFGTQPQLTGSGAGAAPNREIVQATTSWGYVRNSIQVVGASTFAQNAAFPSGSYSEGGRNYGGGNIGFLIREACGLKGRGQVKGACF